MNSIQKSYLAALDPKFAVKVIPLDGRPVPIKIIQDINKTLPTKYKTYFDEEEKVIYIGKGI